MKEPRIVQATAADGRPIVLVEITCRPGLFASVDQDAYDAWVASGRSLRWYLNQNGDGTSRVVTRPHHRTRIVAVGRLLTGAGPTQMVRYADRDCLNLRQDNLQLVRRGPAPSASLPTTSESL